MPRPKLQSDEAIVDAASAILLERGLGDFTLSHVAERVGLSRAAIIQRFGSKDELLRQIARREVVLTRAYMESFNMVIGWAGLRDFLRTIVDSMGPGEDFTVRAQLAWAESVDPELRALAGQRYRMVQDAIAQRLPEEVKDRDNVAAHLHAVIAGATMQWLAEDHPDLADYVNKRVETALAILQASH